MYYWFYATAAVAILALSSCCFCCGSVCCIGLRWRLTKLFLDSEGDGGGGPSSSNGRDSGPYSAYGNGSSSGRGSGSGSGGALGFGIPAPSIISAAGFGLLPTEEEAAARISAARMRDLLRDGKDSSRTDSASAGAAAGTGVAAHAASFSSAPVAALAAEIVASEGARRGSSGPYSSSSYAVSFPSTGAGEAQANRSACPSVEKEKLQAQALYAAGQQDAGVLSEAARYGDTAGEDASASQLYPWQQEGREGAGDGDDDDDDGWELEGEGQAEVQQGNDGGTAAAASLSLQGDQQRSTSIPESDQGGALRRRKIKQEQKEEQEQMQERLQQQARPEVVREKQWREGQRAGSGYAVATLASSFSNGSHSGTSALLPSVQTVHRSAVSSSLLPASPSHANAPTPIAVAAAAGREEVAALAGNRKIPLAAVAAGSGDLAVAAATPAESARQPLGRSGGSTAAAAADADAESGPLQEGSLQEGKDRKGSHSAQAAAQIDQ